MLKLFIIEDDINIQASLQAKFTLSGFDVEINNEDRIISNIINKVKDIQPDYIIADLTLPYMDGFEVIKTIKSNPELIKIPIFIFTHLSDLDSKARGDQLGVEYYFLKDELMIDEFVEKTIRIIKNRKRISL